MLATHNVEASISWGFARKVIFFNALARSIGGVAEPNRFSKDGFAILNCAESINDVLLQFLTYIDIQPTYRLFIPIWSISDNSSQM